MKVNLPGILSFDRHEDAEYAEKVLEALLGPELRTKLLGDKQRQEFLVRWYAEPLEFCLLVWERGKKPKPDQYKDIMV